MASDLLALAAELHRIGESFVLATVVRCERPTSAKPGAKALIRPDGTVSGWVGGACAEPVVVREALNAFRDGQPRLISLIGEGRAAHNRTEGVIPYAMTCHSGGTLEIYVEPFLPKPLLVLVGHGPVVDTLAALAHTADFAVSLLTPETMGDALARAPLTRDTLVVVGTHGAADEEALERVLNGEAGYVSLIASRKRAAAVVENLRRRGVSADRIDRLKAPAGLDLGATTPEEIAVSILAEIVQHRRGEKSQKPEVASALERTDPVCGMMVDVASARHRSDAAGGAVYFCCSGCKDAFDREPQKYAVDLADSRS